MQDHNILRFDQGHGEPKKPRVVDSGRREFLQKAGQVSLVGAFALYLRSRYMAIPEGDEEQKPLTGIEVRTFADGWLAEFQQASSEGSDSLSAKIRELQPIVQINFSQMTPEQQHEFLAFGIKAPATDQHRTALRESLDRAMQ
ncbi:hypothetical protein EXS65_02610 [Candidatus Peribacteria bacterium]|nr:hypothetical protein [Candidatus Peribacteria bacterium]